MIKIAYIIDTIHSLKAGTEKQLSEIVRRLDRDIFDPYLICLWKSPWMEHNALPVKVFELGYKGLVKPNIAKVISSLVKIIKKEQFDIMQTFFEDSILIGYVGAFFSGNNPILLSSRRDMGMGDEEPWYHALYRKMYPLVFRGFHGIVVNGESVFGYAAQMSNVPYEKIKVIHNGISINEKTEIIPQIFRDNPADIWIGIAANLKPIKRLDIFVEAFRKLLQLVDNLTIKAIILGEGPLRISLTKMLKEYDLSSHVFLAGSVDDVTVFLNRCNIGVLCSDREGFPNAVLEYMACGLPVVATRVGGNRELVDHTNGICVPPGDPHALASALSTLCMSANMRNEKGLASKEKVRQEYSWDRSMREWEGYYQSLVK